MSMIYILQDAPDNTIETLLANPDLISTFIGGPQPKPANSPGFFARLLGVRQADVEQEEVNPIELETGDEHCDLDKAWHGIHFLLSGSDWQGEPPAAFLLNWGTEVGDIDVGYGPARAFNSSQVKEINDYLSDITEEHLKERFNPQKMMEEQIYPTIWDHDPAEDDTFGYLMVFFGELKQFISNTAACGKGMVVYLG